jgi:hypothetical protein
MNLNDLLKIKIGEADDQITVFEPDQSNSMESMDISPIGF